MESSGVRLLRRIQEAMVLGYNHPRLGILNWNNDRKMRRFESLVRRALDVQMSQVKRIRTLARSLSPFNKEPRLLSSHALLSSLDPS